MISSKAATLLDRVVRVPATLERINLEGTGNALVEADAISDEQVHPANIVNPALVDLIYHVLKYQNGGELLPLVQALGVRFTKAKRMQAGERAHLLLEHHGVAECRAIALRVLSERKGRVRAVRHEQVSLSSTHNPHV